MVNTSAGERQDERVLLVEDNPGDRRLIQEMLAEAGAPFRVTCVDRLADATDLMARGEGEFIAIILDLTLSDSSGLDTLHPLRQQAAHTPIVIVSGTTDEKLAVQAVQLGAQDFLVKGHFDALALSRAVLYAIERMRAVQAMRSRSMMDDLTGLYGRSSFMTLAEQHCQMARLSHQPFTLYYVDVDGLRFINEGYGHAEGDAVLCRVADALRSSLRKTDIIARYGGDEFIGLAVGAPEGVGGIANRIVRYLEGANRASGTAYAATVSIGTAGFDPARPVPLDVLISLAEEAMRRSKRKLAA